MILNVAQLAQLFIKNSASAQLKLLICDSAQIQLAEQADWLLIWVTVLWIRYFNSNFSSQTLSGNRGNFLFKLRFDNIALIFSSRFEKRRTIRGRCAQIYFPFILFFKKRKKYKEMSKKLPLLRVPFYSPIETQANTISPLRWANLTTKKRWSCLCNERETVELRTRRAATATYSQIRFNFFRKESSKKFWESETEMSGESWVSLFSYKKENFIFDPNFKSKKKVSSSLTLSGKVTNKLVT